jgi:hypothetical protein
MLPEKGKRKKKVGKKRKRKREWSKEGERGILRERERRERE